MKARDLLVPVLRDVIGRNTAAGTGVGVAVASDEPIMQVAGVLVLLVNVVADFIIELRKQRAIRHAANGASSRAPPAP